MLVITFTFFKSRELYYVSFSIDNLSLNFLHGCSYAVNFLVSSRIYESRESIFSSIICFQVDAREINVAVENISNSILC